MSLDMVEAQGETKNVFGNTTMGFTGKLIIKAELKGDIRLLSIENSNITYDELIGMLERVFRGKLNSEEILLKYKDEDGDMITITGSSDLTLAMQSGRTLRFKIYMKNEQDMKIEKLELPSLRSELKLLRDRVNNVLEMLGDEKNLSTSDSKPVMKNQDQPAVTGSLDGNVNLTSQPSLTGSSRSGLMPIKSVESSLGFQHQPSSNTPQVVTGQGYTNMNPNQYAFQQPQGMPHSTSQVQQQMSSYAYTPYPNPGLPYQGQAGAGTGGGTYGTQSTPQHGGNYQAGSVSYSPAPPIVSAGPPPATYSANQSHFYQMPNPSQGNQMIRVGGTRPPTYAENTVTQQNQTQYQQGGPPTRVPNLQAPPPSSPQQM